MAQHSGNISPRQTTKQAILSACSSGDLPALQHLFKALDITPGSEILYLEDEYYGVPDTQSLLATAITHNHLPIISYLISIYISGPIECQAIINAILANPNMNIVYLLHKRSPSLVHFEWNDYMRTFITEACRGGPESIPLIYYLLEQGVDLSAGGLGAVGPIGNAVLYQPVEVIERILERKPWINYCFSEAIRQRRVDVIRLFFEKAVYGHSNRELLKEARRTGDRAVMVAVREGVKRKRKRYWQVWRWC